MTAASLRRATTIAAGAGFAGDRIEPAVAQAGSGEAHAVVLECLAERTIVAGLHWQKAAINVLLDLELA